MKKTKTTSPRGDEQSANELIEFKTTKGDVEQVHAVKQLRFANGKADTESRYVGRRRFVLTSMQAQRIMNRTYVRLMTDFHTLGSLVNIYATDQQFHAINQAIEERFAHIHQALDHCIADAEKSITNNGIAEDMFPTKVVGYDVDFNSNYCKDFIALVTKQDTLNRLLNEMMFGQLLTLREKDNLVYEWQTKLFKFTNEIRAMSDDANRLMDKKADKPSEKHVKAKKQLSSADSGVHPISQPTSTRSPKKQHAPADKRKSVTSQKVATA